MEETVQFYTFVSNLSKLKKNEEKIPENINLIASLIIASYKEHVMTAASAGREFAYIFAYNIKAKYKNILLQDYIFPNDELAKKIKDKNLSTVRELVNAKMYPFILTYNILDVQESKYVVLIAQWN